VVVGTFSSIWCLSCDNSRPSLTVFIHYNCWREKKVLDYAEECGNVSFACRKYGVSRDSFYRWKKQHDNDGIEALANSKPCPENPAVRVAKEIEDKILYVRKEFGLGPQRISWYLDRHYGMTVSTSGARSVLCRHG